MELVRREGEELIRREGVCPGCVQGRRQAKEGFGNSVQGAENIRTGVGGLWGQKELPHNNNCDTSVSNILLSSTKDDGVFFYINFAADEIG